MCIRARPLVFWLDSTPHPPGYSQVWPAPQLPGNRQVARPTIKGDAWPLLPFLSSSLLFSLLLFSLALPLALFSYLSHRVLHDSSPWGEDRCSPAPTEPAAADHPDTWLSAGNWEEPVCCVLSLCVTRNNCFHRPTAAGLPPRSCSPRVPDPGSKVSFILHCPSVYSKVTRPCPRAEARDFYSPHCKSQPF